MEQTQRVPCPYCRELILPGAIKCKECGSSLARQWAPGSKMVWARSLPDRKVLGVSACIAHNFRVSPTLVRLTFVLLTFVSLLGLFLYLGLAAIIPPAPGQRSLFEKAVDAMGAALDNFRQPPVPEGAEARTTAYQAAPFEPPPAPAPGETNPNAQ